MLEFCGVSAGDLGDKHPPPEEILNSLHFASFLPMTIKMAFTNKH